MSLNSTLSQPQWTVSSPTPDPTLYEPASPVQYHSDEGPEICPDSPGQPIIHVKPQRAIRHATSTKQAATVITLPLALSHGK